MEQEVDEVTVTASDSPFKLFQGKALLKTLQNKLKMIRKFNAEIELVIEDEDDLVSELEQQRQFQFSASVTIARLSALIAKNEKERHRPPHELSTDPSSSSSATSRKTKLPELRLLTLTGSLNDW